MVSTFEYMLLCRTPVCVAFRLVLLDDLDDGVSLHRLRSTSKHLHALVDQTPGRVFEELYIRAPFAANDSTTTLDTIAPFCHDLTISVGYDSPRSDKHRLSLESTTSRSSIDSFRSSRELREPIMEKSSRAWRTGILRGRSRSVLRKRTSSSSIASTATSTTASEPPTQLPFSQRRQQDDALELWSSILCRFHELRSLTLRVNGDPGWPGRTEIETVLINLRIAIERADSPQLRTVILAPVQVMGIVHLRWSGLGAFGPAVTSQSSVWQRIETLDLRIESPFAPGKLSEGQQKMFKQIFHRYLESFAPSLKCLRVIWLDGEGPSPLALHMEPGLGDREVIEWPNLEQLWVGNITRQHLTIALARDDAPLLTMLKMQKSTRRESLTDISDSSAWVDIQLNRESTESFRNNRASSLYSQSAKSVSTWAGGISRSSREVPFILDL